MQHFSTARWFLDLIAPTAGSRHGAASVSENMEFIGNVPVQVGVILPVTHELLGFFFDQYFYTVVFGPSSNTLDKERDMTGKQKSASSSGIPLL